MLELAYKRTGPKVMSGRHFSFYDLTGTLYKILETATDDVVGLYETHWCLPEGEIADPDVGYSKKYPLAVIIELNETLVRKGYLTILATSDGEFIPSDDRSVLMYPWNYRPFRISSEPGYVLVATERGATLRARIAKHSPRVLLAH